MITCHHVGRHRDGHSGTGVGKLWPMGQFHPTIWFYTAHETRMAFILLNGWEKQSKRKIIICDMWKWSEIPVSVTINEVLLEHNHTHLLPYDIWLPSHYNSRAGLWQRPHGLQSLKHLLAGPLQEKCANPWSRAWGERQTAWWAGQKSKGSLFHGPLITSSHLNLTAAPWDRWDGRKLRNREVMSFHQGLIAG